MDAEACLEEARAQCTRTMYLDFDGFIVQFGTNSLPLIKALQGYYKHFLTDRVTKVDCLVRGLQTSTDLMPGEDWQVNQPEPGKTKIKEHLLLLDSGEVVRKLLTGVHLLFIDSERVCAGPLEANLNQVLNFISNVHLDRLLGTRGQLFHAAGVCAGSIGLGMAGQSGKGKSTLALRLLQQGLDLVSNDRLVVQDAGDGLRMFGVARYPRVNPGTVIHQPELVNIVSPENLKRYQAMARAELWGLEEKYDAFVEPAFNCAFKLTAKMKMFVMLDWDRNLFEPPSLDRVAADDYPQLVETVMKSPGAMLPVAAKRIGEATVAPYMELLEKCELYRLSGGVDFDQASREIKTLLIT